MIHFHEAYYWYITAPLYLIIPLAIYYFSRQQQQLPVAWTKIELLSEILSYALIGIIGSTLFGMVDAIKNYPLRLAMQEMKTNYRVLLGVGHFYGALLCSVLFMIHRLYSLAERDKYGHFMDVMALLIAVTTILGKVACFCSGHAGCYGIPTHLPWGVHFVNESNDSLVSCHPLQLYAVVINIILLLVLYVLRHRLRPGYLCIAYLVLNSISNIGLEFLMPDNALFACFNLAQCSYLVILIVALILFKVLTTPRHKLLSTTTVH